MQRFRREFDLASRLNHPNIVAAVDADEDRGVQFLTMDDIEGHDLDDLVSEVGPLPIKLSDPRRSRRRRTGRPSASIVHRHQAQQPDARRLGVVRVLDLGLARVMEAASPIGQSLGGTGGLTLKGPTWGPSISSPPSRRTTPRRPTTWPTSTAWDARSISS